jgi:hypothetical protein
MRRVNLIVLILTVALVSGVWGNPAVDVSLQDKFQFRDVGDQSTDLTATVAPHVYSTAQQGTTYFGGTVWAADSARWEAIPDSQWTFDSGVGSHFDLSAPHVDPFKSVGLHAYMEGWIGFDNTYLEIPYFRRLSSGDSRWGSDVCVGAEGGLGGEYSFWAGVFPGEADDLCWAAGQGYGNGWNLCLTHAFDYEGGSINLQYDFVNDTEPGFDYTYVLVDTTGDGDDALAVAHGGFVSGHQAIALLPGTHLPLDPGPIIMKFCVVSDIGYSDEDGLYATDCGAFAVDNISLSGGVTHTTDFETGADGWALETAPPGPGADWSNLAAVSDLPIPFTPCDCSHSDSVLVFDDHSIGTGHNLFSDNLAASPWIDLLAAGEVGVPGKVVEYDIYAELPLLNYIFGQTQVQWYPWVCPFTGKLTTSPWTSTGFVDYYGNAPICTTPATGRIQTDFSAFADAGAEQIRIAVGVISYCRYFPDCGGVSNSTPWYDNVRLGVFGNPGAPFLSSSTVDWPQDSFPENGSLQVSAPGRIDCNNVHGAAIPEIRTTLGDTLIVNGGSGGAEVYVQFAIDPGPGINHTALESFYDRVTLAETKEGRDWYYARMDTAEIDGVVSPGTWMTAFHEEDPAFVGSDSDRDPNDIDPLGGMNRLLNDIFPDDLVTPGSRLDLFYKTRFIGGSVWFTDPDTTGGNYYEMEVMPSSFQADSTFNCVLYVDHADNFGAQPFIETALANLLGSGSENFEGTNWDRYDVRAPDSQQGSFGRPLETEYGAALNQALGYKVMLWNSGLLDAFGVVNEDAHILIPWLTLTDFELNNLYLSGDGIAAGIVLGSAAEPNARALLEDLAGVLWTCDTFREFNCPEGSPQDNSVCVNLGPETGARVANALTRSIDQLGQGNGCPVLHSFDVLAVNDTPNFGVAIPDERYEGAKTALYASISNDAADQGGLTYKTLVDGVSVHYRRDDDGSACVFNPPTPPVAVEERLREVLTWFGYLGGASCSDPTVGVSVPDIVDRPSFRTTLGNFAPNPLLSGKKGRIRFTLEREGRASIHIFDLNGRKVKTVFDGIAAQGPNQAFWDGTDAHGRSVASGVYFYRLQALEEKLSRKLVVVKRGS